MLRVLHHYLPIRKAVLILSETVLLTLVIAAWMTAHLWDPSSEVRQLLAREAPPMSPEDALETCFRSALFLSVLAQLAIAFNELYDVRVSSSRYDRAARFVESAGSALGLSLLAVVLVQYWRLKNVLDFPPLSLSTRVQTLVFALLSSFVLLYFWRTFFHYLLYRASFSERVLILGSGKAAHALAREMLERPDAGYEIVGLVPETERRAEAPRRGADLASGLGANSGSESRRAGRVAEARAGAQASTGAVGAGIGAGVGTGAASGAAAGALLGAPQESAAGAGPGAAVRTAAGRAGPSASGALALVEEPPPHPAPVPDTQSLVLPPLASLSAALRGESGSVVGLEGAGASTALFELCQRERVDLVVVALEDRREHLPTEELLQCRLGGIAVREQEALYEQITGKIAVEALRPSYLIFNEGFSRHPWNELAKRAVDIVLAALMLLLTWPLMLATAIAVRMDSPGPILFTQERVGRDGRPFTLLKFRSMRSDAEKVTGPVWATADDPRITRSGRFIRRTRLDELPQLFNVIAGHMSLVGPRPEREHFVADLAKKIPYFRQRHIVKPGLTGWAQINYRYGSTFEDALQKLQYDLFYIKNQSLLFDLSILFNTVKTVILRKGT